jgi:transcription termination factor Rho
LPLETATNAVEPAATQTPKTEEKPATATSTQSVNANVEAVQNTSPANGINHAATVPEVSDRDQATEGSTPAATPISDAQSTLQSTLADHDGGVASVGQAAADNNGDASSALTSPAEVRAEGEVPTPTSFNAGASTDTDNARVDNFRNDNRAENRTDNRNLPAREERVMEGRGLRFRGRDGRAELRTRGDGRNFRGRGDAPNRPDNRGGDNNRGDNWRDNAESGNGRLMSRDSRDNQRDNGRDNQRDKSRDNGRDASRDHGGQARLTERDVARGRNELDLTTLEDKGIPELRDIALEMGIAGANNLKKNELVFRILEAQAETSGNLFKQGILEILSDGKGFLRTSGYLPGDEDVYVSQSQIKRFNLKTGDTVSGQVRPPKDMERHYGLLRVEAIDGEAPENMRQRKEFEKMTPIFPDEKFKLETSQENITARIIDLVSPIGKGQRGLIVAPPKAGKTTLIKNIANSIALNHPEVVLMVLLIDERPEEVTDISRSVRGEVVASTFDEMPENHMRVAEMVFEKAKRLVEQHKDVVILLDSITRLSRASNLVVTPSGRTLSGGLDPAAMYRPKRMFGAARNIEEGGSLTILATTLVDTGSRMDDMIFEEFKGTGNMDLVLDRNLFDQRIFPAIDINKSGTRRDDLLLSKEDLAATYHLRRTLAALDNDKAITLLIDRLKNTKTNLDFMQIVQKSARQGTQ